MYQDEKGNLLSKEQLYANMKHHIQAVVERYKDVAYCWDVVNEAVADSPVRWGQPALRQSPMYQIAGEEFIYKAFEYAHEADPNALLFYNDYNDAEPEKSQRIYELVKRMKEAGVPIDGIGMQAHYNIYGPSEQEIDAAITKYKELVKHIHITELDIRVNTEMGGGLMFNRGEARPIAQWEQSLQADQYVNPLQGSPQARRRSRLRNLLERVRCRLLAWRQQFSAPHRQEPQGKTGIQCRQEI